MSGFFTTLWDYALLALGLVLVFAAVYAWIAVRVFGHYIGLVCGLIAVAIFGHAKGAHDARATCDTAAIQTKLDAANADLATIREKAAQAEKQAATLGASVRERTGQVDDLRTELDKANAEVNRALAERNAVVESNATPLTGVVSAPPAPAACPPARVAPYRITPADIGRLRLPNP